MNDVFPGADRGPLIITNPPEKVAYPPNREGRRAAVRELRLIAKRARKFARVITGRQRRG